MLPAKRTRWGKKNNILGTHLRMFLHENPEKWSIQVHFFAHAHNTQPISLQRIWPYEVNFQTLLRIPLNFPLNVSRKSFREYSAQTCSDWPPYSRYQLTDLYPILVFRFWNNILFGSISKRAEKNFLRIYKAIWIKHYRWSDSSHIEVSNSSILEKKLKPLRIRPLKILNKHTEVT